MRKNSGRPRDVVVPFLPFSFSSDVSNLNKGVVGALLMLRMRSVSRRVILHMRSAAEGGVPDSTRLPALCSGGNYVLDRAPQNSRNEDYRKAFHCTHLRSPGWTAQVLKISQ